jgi:flagellar biosynthesis/type III secretory pathway protein FliH
MRETLRINLTRGVSTVSSISEFDRIPGDPSRSAHPTAAVVISPSETLAIEQQKKELANLCETVGTLVGKLNRLYEQSVAHNRAEIAKLAVEIARKIVKCEIPKGGYDIHAIIEDALSRAPTRQDLVVRVNPEDAPLCQNLQEERPDGEFAKLQFVPDWSVARANCLIETPKGIVRSFVEEGLERVREALEKSQ